MGADYQEMIAKLQQQLAASAQPQFGGISAPVDPAVQQNLIQMMQNQQNINGAGNDQGFGEWNPLFNAGKKDAARFGAFLGDASQQAATALGAPNQNAIGTQQAQAIKAAILGAKNDYAQQIANGVAPDVANVATLGKLVQAGVPGADAKLQEAQQQVLKNQDTTSSASKNNAEVSNYASEEADRLAKQARETAAFIPRPDLSNSEFYAQEDPNTHKVDYTKRGDKMPPPPLSPAADSARDVLARKVANYDLQLGTAVGRGGGDLRQDLLTRAIAINPDYDEKNYGQSVSALKAYGPSGTQGQLMLKTQNAMNHLAALQQYGQALDSGDAKKIASLQNYFGQELNLPANAAYSAIAPIVANEVSGSLVKGGGGVDERQDRAKELGAQLNTPARDAAVNGMRSLLGAQYKNNQHLYETTTLRKDFQDRFPIEGAFPAPPGTGAGASSGPMTLDSYLASKGN